MSLLSDSNIPAKELANKNLSKYKDLENEIAKL